MCNIFSYARGLKNCERSQIDQITIHNIDEKLLLSTGKGRDWDFFGVEIDVFSLKTRLIF